MQLKLSPHFVRHKEHLRENDDETEGEITPPATPASAILEAAAWDADARKELEIDVVGLSTHSLMHASARAQPAPTVQLSSDHLKAPTWDWILNMNECNHSRQGFLSASKMQFTDQKRSRNNIWDD